MIRSIRALARAVVSPIALCLALGLVGAAPVALSQVTGSLVDVASAGNFNALERAAALANQATYNQLVTTCGVGQNCSPGDLVVFENTRELVDTANELLGSGSTQFSLGLDSEGLGFALRWTAAEEMAAQGSSTTKFAASQLSALATRIAALRWGVKGLRRADASELSSDTRMARNRDDDISGGGSGGGGASADATGDYDRWGGFADGSFGYGSKDPTDLEDAFAFDGQEVTAGLDYRFSSAFVAGVILGYSDKEVDFDSARSIVDGGIVSDGFSAILFAMLEGDKAFLTASVGYQRLQHDVKRRITYPSLNPTVESVDSTARSSSNSSSVLATLGAGYAMRLGAFSIEPSLDATYSNTTVDAFTETSVDNLNPDVDNDPFNLRVGKQSIESLDVAPGIKLQYVFAPKFGALIPYLVGRYHMELSDDARVISAQYADAIGQIGSIAGSNFAVSTDVPDDRYYTVAGGMTVAFGSGLNGFVQYLKVFELDNYTDAVITGGFRYEF
ncbi:MAG TPA: autotransporter outer membrane beta-barrel domain-containing protein [Steroidobacteraceae bacterium]